MSYSVVDEKGIANDFASNKGLQALESLAEPGGALEEFLVEGEADAELVEAIVEECRGKEGLDYVSKLLSTLKPPLTLTSGA